MGVKNLSSRAIIGEFYLALEDAAQAPWVDALSMYFESDQENEEYKWLGAAPSMREWVGGRHAKGLRDQGIVIPNLKFESTIEIPKRWIDLDKTGQIMMRVREVADQANLHWEELLTTAILAGESSVCYDGQYFFDTDHEEGDSGTQSNALTLDISAVPANTHGSTTAPSPEELRAMAFSGVKAIRGFKNDQGKAMNNSAREFTVMVPTSYLDAAEAAFASPIIGGDTNYATNSSNFRFTVAENGDLTWTDKVGVFRTDARAKPFIRQEVGGGVNVAAIAEGSELEFTTGMHQYGVDAERNVGYGYWQHAALVQAV